MYKISIIALWRQDSKKNFKTSTLVQFHLTTNFFQFPL
nr:MAG TPA: hypothetical protein [Bacteriophage sp.]